MKSSKLFFQATHCLTFISVFFCSLSFAQTNPDEQQGLRPYDSFHGGDLDSISMTTGGLALHIPLASFPQRGNLDLSFMVRFSNKQWQTHPTKTGVVWAPAPNSVSQIVSSVDWWIAASASVPDDMGNITWTQSATSPDGASHPLGGRIDAVGTPVFPLRSRDATGLIQTDANTLILPNGTRYNFSGGNPVDGGGTRVTASQPSSITDANGNQITLGSNGWTDTLGRVIPGSIASFAGGNHEIQPGVPTTDLSHCPSGTTAALIWNIPGPANINNGIRTFYFCYSSVNIAPVFNGATVYQATWTMLSAIVLPDLTMWTLAYDSYGDVTRLGFPTGGSISYTYAIGPSNCSHGGGAHQSMWVKSRTVDANDGTGGHTWTYSSSAAGTQNFAVAGTAVVTSPDGNDTVHTINEVASQCPGYDVETQSFQGPAGNNVLLQTSQTLYAGNVNTDAGTQSSANVVPAQVTTTLSGGQSSRVVNTWDSPTTDVLGDPIIIGSLLQKDEYDFSNALVRSTVNHYLWQDNAGYLNNNFVKLLTSSTLKDGAGNQVSQTTYAYDQGSLVASGVGAPTHVGPPAGEPVRGNRTTANHWLDSSNSFLSSTATFFDTGMPATSTPPANADGKNRTTTYTYSSTFLGAYLTQTNMPDTQMPDTGAPVVHHVISGNYDFNTGLLASFTDENSQTYSYQYDNMLRLTQGNHPDGGITKFNYPDPNTVERQRLITGSTYDDYKVKFDGLGRAYETQQLTPECPSYIKVDTTYDSLGRAATVSNPYCLTSETTYGLTQTQYDALSRPIKVIKQDQSSSTAQYNSPPGDGSPVSSLVCTTAIDEAGKQRQVCSDALGRMVKVIEPNPSAAAVNAKASVAISGNEQSSSQSGIAGTGWVTITGSEGKVTTCVRTTCHTVYDTGTVSITANGHTDQYNYGQGDTATTVATNLANLIRSNSPYIDYTSVITNSTNPPSATINLTARTVGASTNYSLSATSVDTDTSGNFTSPSFTTSTSGSALTGGRDGSTTSDTGTVTININGTAYQTSYGAGDSTSSIASRLATAINGGSLASATPNGGTINLSAKPAGTVGNSYTLSASYTWDTAHFANPSFTTSVTSPFGGGLDAGAVNNNPYVTTYQYNARGNMLCVHQKATDTSADVACTATTAPSVPAAWRQRFFTYDSFSRILTATNPETNSTGSTKIAYTYDADSNLASKNEPAPNQAWGSSSTVTINYSYDALNRLLDTTFSDGTTPTTSHRYDYSSYLGQTLAYPIGREVAATSVNNTIAYFMSYDKMGRVAQTVQCTPGVTNCQAFTASYGQVGQLLTLGYPGNGFTVTYGYDTAARLASAVDSSGVTYAQNPTYLASGAIQEFTAPNFNNNKYHVDYNNRLQPTEIWTGSAEGASALFDKKYQYNPPNLSQANNGNVYTVTNVVDNTRTQTFTYDSLNRLVSAGDQTHWSNTYTYDAWGNLTQKTPGPPAGENLSKSADANNHLSGLTYDAGGNEINDGLGNTFVYDAENRITTTAGVTYTYDAAGRRIKKSNGTNYWYGPSGNALAETDSGGNWTYYIFFGGQRLARNVPQPSPNPADIKYYITDHLHSTAMFVDKAGTTAAILDDNDFYPWGGVVPGVGKTTSNNSVKFTGQYRDTESSLDYFGARYYAGVNGRFMSPDWAAKPVSVPYAQFGDPQSLNLYAYVRNSPIIRVDADGHAGNYGSSFAIYDTPLGVSRGGGTTWGDASECEEETCTEAQLAVAQPQSQNQDPAPPPPPPPPGPPTPQQVNGATPTATLPGEHFNSVEAAVKDGLTYVNPTSKSQNKEYAGTTVQNADGSYSNVGPVVGTVNTSHSPLPPNGTKMVALWHTHGGNDPHYDSEHFSPQDKSVARNYHVPAYIATPANAIRKYDPSTKTVTTIQPPHPDD